MPPLSGLSLMKGKTAIDFSICSVGFLSLGKMKYPAIINDRSNKVPAMILVFWIFLLIGFSSSMSLDSTFRSLNGFFNPVIISLIALATLLT